MIEIITVTLFGQQVGAHNFNSVMSVERENIRVLKQDLRKTHQN
jgi:hypothetical protein